MQSQGMGQGMQQGDFMQNGGYIQNGGMNQAGFMPQQGMGQGMQQGLQQGGQSGGFNMRSGGVHSNGMQYFGNANNIWGGGGDQSSLPQTGLPLQSSSNASDVDGG